MKHLKTVIVFLLFISLGFSAMAQNSERKWTFGAGAYFADFVAPQLDFPRQFRDTYWNHKGIPIQLSLGRYISDRFNVVGVFSMVDLDNPNLPTNNTFWQFNAGAQFNLIKDNWFQPYLLANIGYGGIKDEGTMAYNAGIGFNIWPVKYVGL